MHFAFIIGQPYRFYNKGVLPNPVKLPFLIRSAAPWSASDIATYILSLFCTLAEALFCILNFLVFCRRCWIISCCMHAVKHILLDFVLLI